MTQVKSNDESIQDFHNCILEIIKEEDYEGILAQDGWETLYFTIQMKHTPTITSVILNTMGGV